MPSIQLKDAAGVTRTVQTLPAVGPAGVHDSLPVVPASTLLDAFGRLRVGAPTLLLDTKRISSVPDIGMTQLATAGGSVSYSAETAATTLTIQAGSEQVTRQTRQRAVYQPGKSMLVFMTFGMGTAVANVKKRVGLFDDFSGVYLEKDGTGIPSFNIRRKTGGVAVNTTVVQSAWNIDKLDGTGRSGITLDLTKVQILYMDLEWLGVGRVRVGFVINGAFLVCHEFYCANIATQTYMQNPNLPMRWQILGAASGAPASLDCICGQVSSEGGYDVTGITASFDTGSTAESIPSNGFEELLAIRIKAAHVDAATAFAAALSVMNTTTAAFLWRLVMSPTNDGGGTWVSVPNSIMEANVGRVATIDTGILIASGFVSSNANAEGRETSPVLKLGKLLTQADPDDLSLQVLNLNNQTESFFGSITWREVF